MQQVAPPLTGIHTPNKAGNSVFAFGHRNITHESSVPLIGTSKRKPSGMRSWSTVLFYSKGLCHVCLVDFVNIVNYTSLVLCMGLNIGEEITCK